MFKALQEHCPVCGMEIGKDSQTKSQSVGKTVFFAAPHCKSRFDNDPAKFKD